MIKVFLVDKLFGSGSSMSLIPLVKLMKFGTNLSTWCLIINSPEAIVFSVLVYNFDVVFSLQE